MLIEPPIMGFDIVTLEVLVGNQLWEFGGGSRNPSLLFEDYFKNIKLLAAAYSKLLKSF